MFDSGITTLNLAITGKPDDFAAPGNIVSFIGDSDSGKTMLALTCMAASFYKLGGKCNVLFYDFEFACQFDLERLFGKKFSKALNIIRERGMTTEEWQADIRSRYKRSKKPMIVTLDSTDALRCKADVDAGDAVAGGTTKAGFGTGGASAYSRAMPEISKAVSSNEGLLILLSQIRIDPNKKFGSPITRSNGKALNFYSDQMIWLFGSSKEEISDVKVGGWTKIDVRRNKVTGESRELFAPIYPKYGVDDTRSMLHFLAEIGYNDIAWSNKSNINSITVDDKTMTLAKMAEYFEGDDTKGVLKGMVVDAWNKREEELKAAVLADRKPRFG